MKSQAFKDISGAAGVLFLLMLFLGIADRILAEELPTSELDAIAIEHCAPLQHPTRELARAVLPNGVVVTPRTQQYETDTHVMLQVWYPTEAVALCHSHPSEGHIYPSLYDWKGVTPSKVEYVSHKGRLIVLEHVNGEYSLRLVHGKFSDREVYGLYQSAVEANRELL